jgi:hypothetical protein
MSKLVVVLIVGIGMIAQRWEQDTHPAPLFFFAQLVKLYSQNSTILNHLVTKSQPFCSSSELSLAVILIVNSACVSS